jgi:hypothetical protein
MLFRRTWTDRMLRNVARRIEAPLDLIPAGLMPPDVARLVLNSGAMRRLVRLHQYLLSRGCRS